MPEMELQLLNDKENNLETKQEKRDSLGRYIPGTCGGPGWKSRNEEATKLAKLRDELLAGSGEAIAVLRELLQTGDKDTVKVSAAKILIQCAKIIPDQVFHESWKMILKQTNVSEVQGLLTALPQFGQFIRWKMDQDSKETAIDVEPDK